MLGFFWLLLNIPLSSEILAKMQKCRNAEMQKCRNAKMQKCKNAEIA